MDCLATAKHYTGGNWIMFSPGFKCFAKIFYHKDSSTMNILCKKAKLN